MDPITVGGDADVELRDGSGNFSFIAAGKPHLKNGNKTIAPSVGFATMGMVDGMWCINFVRLRGAVIGAKGLPIKRESEFIYSYLPGHPDDEREGYHPDYAPPQWLTDFVNNIQDRLNGKAAKA